MIDTETAYNNALDYLYSFVDYSLKHSSELAKAEFNLDRMFALLEELGNPQTKYPIIHVAGTKGKGSVCALCASALQAAGYTANFTHAACRIGGTRQRYRCAYSQADNL
jgi:dihydrofolate synthase/folylpolyglutamate synthase